MFVRECQYTSVQHFFTNYHYLKRTPAGVLACYGLFENESDFQLIGGAVFTNGRIQYEGRMIEFARLYLFDEVPKNAESWFIGQCMIRLAKKFPTYEGCVSWSDSNRGHKGIIYKASNFVYDGDSRKVKRYKSAAGRSVFQRTVIDENDFEFVGWDEPKKRWIYYFDKRRREKERAKVAPMISTHCN